MDDAQLDALDPLGALLSSRHVVAFGGLVVCQVCGAVLVSTAAMGIAARVIREHLHEHEHEL
ncbi:hypothetical protein [Mobilicoccus massiliensis]|uniref:hypothetical protein n=1 Tax=Mobilicoccus massiliensis TaxID=1522310 RepID=UPI00058F5BC4|nr:hypothetical protein [Mobilicoccus massiliensis]